MPDAIETIEARGAPLNAMLMEPLAQKQRPSTAIDAKFSLPFCIGLALARGAVSLDDFTPAALADPQRARARAARDLHGDSGAGMREAVSGELALHLRSGARHALRVEHPLGHPRHPLSEEQLVAKFVDCAGRAAHPMGEARARLAAEPSWPSTARRARSTPCAASLQRSNGLGRRSQLSRQRGAEHRHQGRAEIASLDDLTVRRDEHFGERASSSRIKKSRAALRSLTKNLKKIPNTLRPGPESVRRNISLNSRLVGSWSMLATKSLA